MLDIGCGEGTWLRAALLAGVQDVVGVDGVEIKPERLLFPACSLVIRDLTRPLVLGRRFELVLCLEVAEHLPASAAPTLIESLTRHSDRILFSAAIPGQPGQHHVNCQWPAYWQRLFNDQGFACEDSVRWQLWDHVNVEPWYRQNLFVATQSINAGKEPRLQSVIHPEMVRHMLASPLETAYAVCTHDIENGGMPIGWYSRAAFKAGRAKLRRFAQSRLGMSPKP